MHSWVSWRLSSPRKALWRSLLTRSGWVKRKCGRTTIGVRALAALNQVGLRVVFWKTSQFLVCSSKLGDYHRTKIAGAKKACEAKKETHCRSFRIKAFKHVCFVQQVCTSMFPANSLFDRKNLYDGVDEYYVVIKEKGSRTQKESQEETKRKTTKLEVHSTFVFFQPSSLFHKRLIRYIYIYLSLHPSKTFSIRPKPLLPGHWGTQAWCWCICGPWQYAQADRCWESPAIRGSRSPHEPRDPGLVL